jgi:hypothetical protein
MQGHRSGGLVQHGVSGGVLRASVVKCSDKQRGEARGRGELRGQFGKPAKGLQELWELFPGSLTVLQPWLRQAGIRLASEREE